MSAVAHVVARERAGAARRWLTPLTEVTRTGTSEPATPTEEEIRSIRTQAYTEGRAEGLEQGLAEGHEAARVELESELSVVRDLCDKLAKPFEEVSSSTEQQLAKLATLIAERVITAELRTQPEQLLAVVHKAVAALPAASAPVTIAVHPAALALLRTGLTGTEERGWQLIADPTLKPGDCRVARTDSIIDGRIETRLKALIDAALGGKG